MFDKLFWKDAGERAAKTIAQAALAVIGVQANSLDEVNFANVASIAGLAGVMSILTSIASAKVSNSNTASLLAKPKENA